jgi:phospholipid/cholesterol/gamma-HCH transport system substrate-binding protein
MSRSLSRWQAIVLGVVVLCCMGIGAWATFRIGSRTSLFQETYNIVVCVADAQDIDKGAPVRVRGVEAGKVVAIEYPDPQVDGEDGLVRLHLELDKKFEGRLFADATAVIANKSMLGTSFIAIAPGKTTSGPLAANVIHARPQPDLTEVTAKLSSVATRIDNILTQVEQGSGTAGKLFKDDSLYNDIKAISTDTKKLIAGTNEAVAELRGDTRTTMTNAQKTFDGINSTLAVVQTETAGLKQLVHTSKDAVTAIKQDAEAIKSMPLVRSYVTDDVKTLVRPNCSKDRVYYDEGTLFEAGRAVLTPDGRNKVGEVAAWLRGQKQKGSEIVVASFVDPKDKNETPASARELTRLRSEAVAALLKESGVARLGYITSRNIVPIGLGVEAPPNVEKEYLPATRTEIILFVPQ